PMFALPGYTKQIYIDTQNREWEAGKNGLDGVSAEDWLTYHASAARHEQTHLGPDSSEHAAYTEQKRILERFGPNAFSNKDWYENALKHMDRGINGEYGKP